MNNDRTLTLDEIRQWMLAVEERAEKAEEQFLDELLAKITKEHTDILENEFGELKELWQPLLEKLKYEIEVIDYLKELQTSVENAAESAIGDPYRVSTNGKQLDPIYVDAFLRKSHAENIKILEAEWADYKDLWSLMIKEGRTAKYALEFLKSFA